MRVARTDASDPRQAAADGRYIDPAMGTLAGEGSQQAVAPVVVPDLAHEIRPAPADALDAALGPSYHGAPVLKEPVWQWYIPAYFYVGGVAGAAAALGAAAQLAVGGGSPGALRRRLPAGEHRLVRRCRAIATAGAGISAALLIADLGRPARFLNMLLFLVENSSFIM
jgi:hypothetical protein